MTALAKLPEKWRAAAQALRDHPSYYVEIRSRGVAAAYDNCADELEAALSPAELGGVGEPLRVFSEGVWVYEETGQRFSARDLDEAAFAEYLRHPLPTPRAAEAVTEEMVDSVRADIMQAAANDGRLHIVLKDEWVRAALTASLTPPSAKGENSNA